MFAVDLDKTVDGLRRVFPDVRVSMVRSMIDHRADPYIEARVTLRGREYGASVELQPHAGQVLARRLADIIYAG